MAKTPKKQLTFALFAEGKRPQDQEVKEIGVKSHTLYNYFQLFKKNGSTSEDHSQSSTSVNPTGVVTATPTSTTSCSRKMVVPQRTSLRGLPWGLPPG